jgi:uncharacterized protein
MLKVGLADLRQQRRLPIDADVPPDDPIWTGAGITFATPLAVTGGATTRGDDVVVRLRLLGEAAADCRRCLTPVRLPVDEEIEVVFRPGVSEVEAEAAEVYPLPERATEVDLAPAVREHTLLAVPQFVECREGCRGLCPRCGAELNRMECGCREEAVDPRWAALRRLSNES